MVPIDTFGRIAPCNFAAAVFLYKRDPVDIKAAALIIYQVIGDKCFVFIKPVGVQQGKPLIQAGKKATRPGNDVVAHMFEDIAPPARFKITGS